MCPQTLGKGGNEASEMISLLLVVTKRPSIYKCVNQVFGTI